MKKSFALIFGSVWLAVACVCWRLSLRVGLDIPARYPVRAAYFYIAGGLMIILYLGWLPFLAYGLWRLLSRRDLARNVR